jgi:hypothetical protein
LRKAKFQAIFKFVLSSASGGAGGGKYNRISAFVSMPVLLIRRSLEKFFKKNFRDDSFGFGFAKVTALAFILSLCTITESRAECYAKESNWFENCYDTWNPGKPDNCGAGCTYDYSDGKLTVTATKSTAVIPEGMFSSYYYNENVLPNIDNIEIVGEFDTIGKHAFVDNSATISGKDDVLYVNNVDHNAFGNDNNTITGTVVLSDKQTSLNAFLYNALLEGTLIIPPTITEFTAWDVFSLNLGENAKIYCGAENCEELFRNVNCDEIEGSYATSCKSHLKTLLSSGKLLAYPDGCTKMGATGCTKCKNANFKLNDGECDRLRWTPAEAAEVLTDDNNNSVTITFKK